MGITMCMYAGVGTQLFAFVKRGAPGGITRQVNFGSFGNTFLILFQIMTSARLFLPAYLHPVSATAFLWLSVHPVSCISTAPVQSWPEHSFARLLFCSKLFVRLCARFSCTQALGASGSVLLHFWTGASQDSVLRSADMVRRRGLAAADERRQGGAAALHAAPARWLAL